jgi:hypothetical protein
MSDVIVTTDDLLEIASHQHNLIEQLSAEVEVLRRSHMLLESRYQQDTKVLREEIDGLRQRVGYMVSREALEGGLFPTQMEHVALIAIQVFHTTTGLTKEQRQARHTPWSLKLEVSVGAKRIKKGINVSLYSGEEFARQVLSMNGTIPSSIARLVDDARDENDPDRLYGMLTKRTSGGGTPRERTQFCSMRGHLLGNPTVWVFVDDGGAICKDWRPGAGTKSGKALWYGICKPERQEAL